MGLTGNILSEIRMGNACQCFSPLTEIFSMQIDNAILGNYVLHMRSCSNYTSARLKCTTILDNPFFVVDGSAIIGLPPSESAAPRIKSI